METTKLRVEPRLEIVTRRMAFLEEQIVEFQKEVATLKDEHEVLLLLQDVYSKRESFNIDYERLVSLPPVEKKKRASKNGQILNFLQKQNGNRATCKAVRDGLGFTQSASACALSRMVARGVLRKDGSEYVVI